MTHDELLARLSEKAVMTETFNNRAVARALRAVVELHKPIKNIWITHPDLLACDECSEWTNEGPGAVEYSCPTIQAIEKELK